MKKNLKNQKSNKTTNKQNNTKEGVPVSKTKTISNGRTKVNRKDDFRFVRREYITDIASSDVFQVNTYECNPGLPGVFPWLSQVAGAFQKYEIHSIRFCFETAQSTFVPGTICMAPEFNVQDPLPESKVELFEYDYAARSAVWENFHVTFSKRDVMNYKNYYVRTVDMVEKILYDPFYLIVAVTGVPESSGPIIGELWVEYDIQFYLPQKLPQSFIDASNCKQFVVNSGSIVGQPDPTFLGSAIIAEVGTFGIQLDQGLSSILFSQDFNGLLVYTAYGESREEGESQNLLEGATLNDVELFTQHATVGNIQFPGGELGNPQNSLYVSLKAKAGGSILVNNNGYESNVATLGGYISFYNGLIPLV